MPCTQGYTPSISISCKQFARALRSRQSDCVARALIWLFFSLCSCGEDILQQGLTIMLAINDSTVEIDKPTKGNPLPRSALSGKKSITSIYVFKFSSDPSVTPTYRICLVPHLSVEVSQKDLFKDVSEIAHRCSQEPPIFTGAKPHFLPHRCSRDFP